MFGLDTKRCSIAGTDLQPAPPKTARNKTNPKSSLPKRISQLQRIANPLSTLECLRRKNSATLASVWRGFSGLENSKADENVRFCLFFAGVLHFPIVCRYGNGWAEKLIPIPAALEEAPKFLDADDCRCSNVCALAASGQSSLPTSRIPHARPRKPY